MSATDKVQDLNTEVMGMLIRFHDENPDLFVDAIDVLNQTDFLGAAKLTGVRITVKVQPYKVTRD